MSTRGRSLIVLVGATASGKTSLAQELSQSLDVKLEVVSLDSRQTYRGLDLGTGKPTAEELAELPHHLLDLVDPDERYDAGSYRRAVEALLPDLFDRDVVPLVVGGAGFYLRALTDGFFDLPDQPERLAEIRAELNALEDAAIREELQRVDPKSAGRIHRHDRYRSERALELLRLTGRTMTELSAEHVPRPVLDLEISIFHLQRPRWQLHKRIARRAEDWLEHGWIEETEGLLEAGWAPDCHGMKILGYREIVAMLQGELARDHLEERVVVATRRYARQQEIWFRKCPAVVRGTREDPRLSAGLIQALETAGRS